MNELKTDILRFQANEESDRTMWVAIFGSCVSRDTCEFLPDAEVVEYVARQSVITALSPVGPDRFPPDQLASSFQARMFLGDQAADGVERIAGADADVVLIDLVDERRGVWRFPDGGFLTNSIEAHRTGVQEWAPREGARLIEFGTDEHFALWKRGFNAVLGRLQALGVPLLLLDIAWAEAYDGSRLPRGIRSELGRTFRRTQRGWQHFSQAVGRGDSLATAAHSFFSPPATPAEQLSIEAREGNAQFRRYRMAAREAFCASTNPRMSVQNRRYVVHRVRDEVRTSADHRWGPAPFHYRHADYESIAAEIVTLVMRGEAK